MLSYLIFFYNKIKISYLINFLISLLGYKNLNPRLMGYVYIHYYKFLTLFFFQFFITQFEKRNNKKIQIQIQIQKIKELAIYIYTMQNNINICFI